MRNALTFDAVFELARTLPGVEESAGRWVPSLKVRGKLLACPAIHRSAEPHSLVVTVGFDERAALIAQDPEVFYVTNHYVNYPSVLVRLKRIRPDTLRAVLERASVSNETGKRKRATRKRGVS